MKKRRAEEKQLQQLLTELTRMCDGYKYPMRLRTKQIRKAQKQYWLRMRAKGRREWYGGIDFDD